MKTRNITELDIEKKIALYGASIWSEIAINGLNSLYDGKVKPDIIIDQVKTGNVQGIPICSIDMLNNAEQYQFILCGSYGFASMKNTLENLLGNTELKLFNMEALIDAADYSSIDSRYDLEEKPTMLAKYHFYRVMTEGSDDEGISFEELYFAITTYCSLKCKKCSPLIPYYKSCDKVHYPTEMCIEALEKLLDNTEIVRRIVLTGGEVFLHPEWDKIVAFCIAQEKIKSVRILTNSTVIPDDTKLKVLANDKVDVLLDDYKEYSAKLNSLMNKFDELGIHYEYKAIDYWFDLNEYSDNGKDEKELEDLFAGCVAGYCFELHGDGHVHRCVHEFAMRKLNLFPSKRKEGFNILDELSPEEIKSELKDMLFGKKYLEGCRYCPGSTKDRICGIAEQIG